MSKHFVTKFLSLVIALQSTLLVLANFDPLRDEGLAYGLRLHRDGVPTLIKRFNSIHGFYAFQELDASKEAIASISTYLSEAFAWTSGEFK